MAMLGDELDEATVRPAGGRSGGMGLVRGSCCCPVVPPLAPSPAAPCPAPGGADWRRYGRARRRRQRGAVSGHCGRRGAALALRRRAAVAPPPATPRRVSLPPRAPPPRLPALLPLCYRSAALHAGLMNRPNTRRLARRATHPSQPFPTASPFAPAPARSFDPAARCPFQHCFACSALPCPACPPCPAPTSSRVTPLATAVHTPLSR